MESTLQEPPWFPARLNLHYRQYEITENNWIILIFIVYLYYIMKDFRIIIWKEKVGSMNSERQIEMDQAIDKVFKIDDNLYNLFVGLDKWENFNIGIDDKDYDDMWNLMKRMAHLVINKHFSFDEDDYYFQELYTENNEVYCEMIMN